MYRITNQWILASVLSLGSDRRGPLHSSSLLKALRYDIAQDVSDIAQDVRSDLVRDAVTEVWQWIAQGSIVYISGASKGWAETAAYRVDHLDARRDKHLRLVFNASIDSTIATETNELLRRRFDRRFPVYQLLVMSKQWWPLWEIHCRLGDPPHAQNFAAWCFGHKGRSNLLSDNYPSPPPWKSEKKRFTKSNMQSMYGEFVTAACEPQGADSFENWLDTLAASGEELSPDYLVDSLINGPRSTLVPSASMSKRYPKCAEALRTLMASLRKEHGLSAFGPEGKTLLRTLMASLRKEHGTAPSESPKDSEIDKVALVELKDGFIEYLSISAKNESLPHWLARLDLNHEYGDALTKVRASALYRWLNRLPFAFNFKNPPDPPPLDEAMLLVLTNGGVLPDDAVDPADAVSHDADDDDDAGGTTGPVPPKVYVDGLQEKLEELPAASPGERAYRKTVGSVIADLCMGESLPDIAGGLQGVLPLPKDVDRRHVEALTARMKEWHDWLTRSSERSKAWLDDPWMESEMPAFGLNRAEKEKQLVPVIDQSLIFLNDLDSQDTLLHECCEYDVEVVIRHAWFTCILEDLTQWVARIKKAWDDEQIAEKKKEKERKK